MKKTVIALFIIVVAASACKKVVDKAKTAAQQSTIVTKVIDDEQELTVPNYPPVTFPFSIKIPLPSFGNPTYIGDFLKEYNTTTDRLISARATKAGLKLISPTNGNLDYLDSLWIYMSAKGLPEQLAAYVYPVPKGVREIAGTLVDKDFKEYFVKDSIFYRIEASATRYPDSNTKVLLYSSFKVEASPIGAN